MVPSNPGVFILTDAGGLVRYVGKAGRLDLWAPEIDPVTWRLFGLTDAVLGWFEEVPDEASRAKRMFQLRHTYELDQPP